MTKRTGDGEARIPELDGIRGVACLMVLGHHYVTGVMPQLSNPFLAAAEAVARPFLLSGVDLFFVLSGFLIGGILIDHRESPNYFSTFYVRRICRIFPVYYLLFFLFLTMIAADLPRFLPLLDLWLFRDPMPLASYATFTQNFWIAYEGHAGAKWLAITWSLAVEEQFYLLFPLIVFLVPPRTVPWIALGGIVCAFILRIVTLGAMPWFATYVLLPCRMDTLMVGVLLAYLVRQPSALHQIQRRMSAIKAGLLVLAAVAVANSLSGGVLGENVRFSLLACIYGLMILVASVDSRSLLARLFRTRFLMFTGAVSYAVYMYHQAVNGLMHGFLLDQAPAFGRPADAAVTAASVTLVFGLGYLSLVSFEKPIRRWGRQFKYRERSGGDSRAASPMTTSTTGQVAADAAGSR